MSSAALQSAPHQATALSSPPLTSNRNYTSPHSSPNRDAYNANAQQQAISASPSSRRPTSRKHNDNASSPYAESPSARAVRNAAAPNSLQEHRTSAVGQYPGMPPVAPPRTSSSGQHPAGASRRNHYANDGSGNSPRQNTDAQRTGSRTGDTNGYPEASRSKRTPPDPYRDHGRPSSNKENRASEMAIPIRTNPTSASKAPYEASENLIRAVSNPQDPNGDSSHHNLAGHVQPDAAPAPVVGTSGTAHGAEERRASRSRHDHSRSHRGTSKFGDFILGNTIGEGEFGKVKLGWKQDSSVQVAIKLIKRDTVGSNPSRLGKIRREVTILRGIHHPNIVRLIDMIETDRYIGIILEYASGGELFDYILNNRYLKDQSARRLFSQLVSGVGYLHKKGIVHRDLKLENLLLDRNRNIIITDFGFANTFNPIEELSDEEELNLTDREYVKRLGLDKVKSNGMRKGDLMQTSCGSPCYAAPELVVSDSLYTGRKVDVWSCGVILYAMLAGYLPFDDDPANPEGDNINLLYKYIVSTPLTFPEYVTPHARDLLRQILVPNPRKRADLFEVARHSWLSEYAHVVEFITSSTTLPSDVQNAGVATQTFADGPMVTRSASVREAPKQKSPPQPAVGGLSKAHGKIDPSTEQSYRTPKDAKRRTVQLEYVAPTTQTQRGSDPAVSARPPVSMPREYEVSRPTSSRDKQLPQEPQDAYSRSTQSRRPQSGHVTSPSTRPAREARATTDNAYMTGTHTVPRPHTGGSLQSRGNYGQPAPPTVADTNVQGRIQQPSSAEEDELMGRASMSVPPKFARMSGFHDGHPPVEARGHKRSSTIGDLGTKLLGRSGSVFGRSKKKTEQPQPQSEKSKKYPPVSMPAGVGYGDEPAARASIDSRGSRRSFSLGISKKRSGSVGGSPADGDKKDRRRFSLLPASFSLKSIGLGKDYPDPASSIDSRHDLPIQSGRTDPPRGVTAPGDARGSTPFFDDVNVYSASSNINSTGARLGTAGSTPGHQRYASAQLDNRRTNAIPPYLKAGGHYASGSESSIDMRRPPTEPQMRSHSQGLSDTDSYEARRVATGRSTGPRGVLQKNNKRFADAYDQDDFRGHHEGSSGAARRVMDFFRRRGKARGGDDR